MPNAVVPEMCTVFGCRRLRIGCLPLRDLTDNDVLRNFPIPASKRRNDTDELTHSYMRKNDE